MKRVILATALLASIYGPDVNTTTTWGVKDTHDAGGSAPHFRLPGVPAPGPHVPAAAGTWGGPAAVRVPRRRPVASRTRPSAPAGKRTHSTAYCETGLMANGQRTYRSAVASNSYPLGTRLLVSDSPYGPGVFTVADRIGHGSELDFAMPGDCDGARTWGRRIVLTEQMGGAE